MPSKPTGSDRKDSPVKDWENTLVGNTATLRDAVRAIDAGPIHICIVVDADGKLLGTVTDGDVRRAILGGADMDSPVSGFMNITPFIVDRTTPKKDISEIAKSELIREFPVVDESGRVVDVLLAEDLPHLSGLEDIWVVLMAGGSGMRLRPLTETTPKPMIEVGNKPLLETILDTFTNQGFRRFYISVNYKAGMIKKHFGDGTSRNIDIRYIEEDERLGTAGSLRLIPERSDSPMIVMNGDLLTKVSFHHLLDYHAHHDSEATMCVRTYDIQVPFGVVDIADNRIRRIDEKPMHSFFVNAGIYVLNPGLTELIPEHGVFDMTSLFDLIIGAGHKTAAFPIREYWIDVGKIADLDRANWDFEKEFE